jgi:hypothetical protein
VFCNADRSSAVLQVGKGIAVWAIEGKETKSANGEEGEKKKTIPETNLEWTTHGKYCLPPTTCRVKDTITTLDPQITTGKPASGARVKDITWHLMKVVRLGSK